MKMPNLQDVVGEDLPPDEYRRLVAVGGFTIEPDFALDCLEGACKALHYTHVGGVNILLSKATMKDGSEWLHMSVSIGGKAPNWRICQLAKDFCMGEDVEAVMVFPKRDDIIDLANCWHLWAPLEDVEAKLRGEAEHLRTLLGRAVEHAVEESE